MKLKIIGIYSIVLGVIVIAYWTFTLVSSNYTEGIIEIGFHIFSEVFMAAVCLISGFLLMAKRKPGRFLNIAGLSMVLYSVLNAAGYFAQRSEWGAAIVFMALFMLSIVILFNQVFRNKQT